MIQVIKAADLNQYAEDDELTSSTLSLSGVSVWGTRLGHSSGVNQGTATESGTFP